MEASAEKTLADAWNKAVSAAYDANYRGRDKPEVYRSTEKSWSSKPDNITSTPGSMQKVLMLNGRDFLATLFAQQQ